MVIVSQGTRRSSTFIIAQSTEQSFGLVIHWRFPNRSKYLPRFFKAEIFFACEVKEAGAHLLIVCVFGNFDEVVSPLRGYCYRENKKVWNVPQFFVPDGRGGLPHLLSHRSGTELKYVVYFTSPLNA